MYLEPDVSINPVVAQDTYDCFRRAAIVSDQRTKGIHGHSLTRHRVVDVIDDPVIQVLEDALFELLGD